MTLSNNKTIKKISCLLAELFKKHPAWLLLLLIGLLTAYLFILFGLYALKNPAPQIEQTNNKIDIEVNKPFFHKGWYLYQTGYDEKQGRWSNLSIIEAVKDPWLYVVYTGIYMLIAGSVFLFWQGKKIKK